jgi:uncharacterized alpha-E superfamily protein
MLSRIAESMFWIGRYVERAEDTARLLQTHLRLIIEDTTANEVDACRNLLALMSVDHVKDPTLTDLLRILGYDPAEPTSIYFCYAAARDNARRAREVIPLDLWECVNSTWHQLPTTPFGPSGANVFLNWARERSAMFAGISRSIMVRDDGWQFMSMGRSLEQVDMTSRMVASASLRQGSSQWPAVLRGCGGHDAFLRTYRGLYTDREVAEFLVVDARFPRSIMHGLIAAADSLQKVAQNSVLTARHAEPALRSLGRLRARLEYADLDELLANLNEEMSLVQDVMAEVTIAVATSYFAAAEASAWTTEGTR